jgi:hypothetical protein
MYLHITREIKFSLIIIHGKCVLQGDQMMFGKNCPKCSPTQGCQIFLGAVARFFLVHNTKNRKTVPNEHTMYQMTINICLHFPIRDPENFSQIGIFGLKTNHLATLAQPIKIIN